MTFNLIALQAVASGAAAPAAGADPAAGSGMMNLLMIVGLIAIFYFFMIRPQQKRQKEVRKFRESLEKGKRVITAGGIIGKIVSLEDRWILLEIADGVRIRIDKGSVYEFNDSFDSSEVRNKEA